VDGFDELGILSPRSAGAVYSARLPGQGDALSAPSPSNCNTRFLLGVSFTLRLQLSKIAAEPFSSSVAPAYLSFRHLPRAMYPQEDLMRLSRMRTRAIHDPLPCGPLANRSAAVKKIRIMRVPAAFYVACLLLIIMGRSAWGRFERHAGRL